MHLTRLFDVVAFLFTFIWVLFLSTLMLTFQTLFIYLAKMFDLPYDVITAIRMIKEMKKSNEDIDETIQK
jgi:hypothetical protein